jgi:hypothetical protein
VNRRSLSITKKISSILLLLTCLLSAACHRGPILPLAPLHTASLDPAQNHVNLASMYVRQAARSRELAEEQANRALVYERLFGADSDWVSSARLLSRFYENAAREQEQQANWHLNMAGQPVGLGEGHP